MENVWSPEYEPSSLIAAQKKAALPFSSNLKFAG